MKGKRVISLLLALFLSSMGVLVSQGEKAEAAGGQEEISVTYQTHVENLGWQQPVKDGETSGTVGSGLRLEAIKIEVKNAPEVEVLYKTHVQNIGWTGDWSHKGIASGSEGRSLRMEAISIKLNEMGDQSQYDIYYRVHCQDYGWLDWAKNGQYTGTEGRSKRLEAIQIKIVKKSETISGATERIYITGAPGVRYQAYVDGKGWMPYVENGALAGTVGEGLSLGNLRVSLANLEGLENEVGVMCSPVYGTEPEMPPELKEQLYQYGGYTYDKIMESWRREVNEGGLGKLNSIGISLYGKAAEKYDIYYRVHLGEKGWLDWASNGEAAGQVGYDLPVIIQAIEVVLVSKGGAAPGRTEKSVIFSDGIK